MKLTSHKTLCTFSARPDHSHLYQFNRIHIYVYISVYIYIYMYIHTYIHAYIHTYIHTYGIHLKHSDTEICRWCCPALCCPGRKHNLVCIIKAMIWSFCMLHLPMAKAVKLIYIIRLQQHHQSYMPYILSHDNIGISPTVNQYKISNDIRWLIS